MRADLVTDKRKLLPDIEKLGTSQHAGLFGGRLPAGAPISVTVEAQQLGDFRQVKLGATLPGEQRGPLPAFGGQCRAKTFVLRQTDDRISPASAIIGVGV